MTVDDRPLHPWLRALHDEALVGAGAVVAREGPGPPAVERLAPGVFRLEVLAPRWCELLLEEVDRAEREAGAASAPPNSLHEYGAALDTLGLAPFLDGLLARVLAPLASSLYPHLARHRLDHHHGFVVDYARDRDEDLAFHADDSEVTLNLCLGGEFQGSELVLRGARCLQHRQTPALPGELLEFDHEPGTALLHLGAHRHEVEPLRRGRRRNLILWCRSRSWRSSPLAAACGEWCGWHGAS